MLPLVRSSSRFAILVSLLLSLTVWKATAYADPADPIPYAWSDMTNPHRVDGLIAQYTKALQQDPRNVELRSKTLILLFAAWRMENKDQKKRIVTGKQVVKLSKEWTALDPKHPGAHHWYGAGVGMIALSRGVLNSLQLVPELKNALEKSAALDDSYLDASALCQLGRMYTMLPGFPLSLGSHQKAMEYLLLAKKKGPGFTLAQLYYADLLWAMGKNTEALAELEKIAPNKPKTEVQYFTYEVNKDKAVELKKLIESGAPRAPFYDVLSDIQPGLVN